LIQKKKTGFHQFLNRLLTILPVRLSQEGDQPGGFVMNISNVSAVPGVYGGTGVSVATPPAGESSTTTQSVITTASGATVTTTRGSQGDIISVTTVAPSQPPPPLPRTTQSTVDITA